VPKGQLRAASCIVQGMRWVVIVGSILLAVVSAGPSNAAEYPWLAHALTRSVATAFDPPAGFVRVPVESGSFADWLRHLPIERGDARLVLYDGRPVVDDGGAAAVVDIDVGHSDLQQCADAVMRLRAEYLYSHRLPGLIGFDLFDGERYRFLAYAEGTTPVATGETIAWQNGRPRDATHADLRRWLDIVYGFASTRSLARELRPVGRFADAAIGDVLVRPGSPGHAVVIVDMASDPASGRRMVIIAESSMPARSVRISRNPQDPALGPWLPLDDSRPLLLPGTSFDGSQLRRF